MKLRPESPLNLAALRVAVPALILLGPELREGTRVASLDRSLWIPPEGLALFARYAPASPRLALAVQLVAAFAALAAIAGVRARVALVVLTLSAGYLFALADLTGWTWHDMHLLWLSALLAASPCDHSFAVDRPKGLPPDLVSVRYARPLFFARLLLAAVYFFPGLHKLTRSGLAWALSDNLRNQLYWKWAEHGFIPAFRADHFPWLLRGGGLFVLLFELVAPLLFLSRRTRLLGAACGLAFHLVAQEILRIPFMSLWGCYVLLVDWGPIVRRLRKRPPPVVVDEAPREPGVTVTGVLLVAGAALQGFVGQTQAFPFACYPTFEWIAGTEMPDLRMVAVLADGSELDVPHARDDGGYRTQRQWGTVWSLAGAGGVTGGGTPADREARGRRLLAYYDAATEEEPLASEVATAVKVRFERVARSVLPEQQGVIVHATVLAELPRRVDAPARATP